LNEHYIEDGTIIYKHACALGCEGACQSGLVQPTVPAGLLIVLELKTQWRRP